ncbi:glycosyltransferase [Sphingomonas sinipercae]|uniref:Glycosyltransferase n=1 Tax=Sphingomonas sinipercae TaxID=2714944 RepID=A0A6G7ZND3_9SPHN|nr:glycosyltransferase [Sphingomonas sinipercae]QIL02429.1 glycosyltransferase [Sphingomonas sinipercae]
MTANERRAFGIEGATKLLLTIARLEPVKMVDHAIRAFAIVHRDHPDALLLLAGDGSDRARLEALALDLGVASNVRFLGLVPQELLSRLEPGCLVLSPLTGMALAETSMAGCPAVAYNYDSAMADLVITGETGVLLSPGDWGAMGREASKLLSDPAKMRSLSTAMRARAEAVCDEQAAYAHEAATYDRLIAANSKRVASA